MKAAKRKLDPVDQISNKRAKADVNTNFAESAITSSRDDITDIHSGLFYLNITHEEYKFHVLSLEPRRGTFNFTAQAHVQLVLKNGKKYQGLGISYLPTSYWDPIKWSLVQRMSIIDAQIKLICKCQHEDLKQPYVPPRIHTDAPYLDSERFTRYCTPIDVECSDDMPSTESCDIIDESDNMACNIAFIDELIL